MQQVISEVDARRVTGGRKPLVPIEYERAISALVACQNIDDAKYFSDKADALAAWAKIHRDDQAGVEAKRLKLHSYRRIDQLARELRPVQRNESNRSRFGPGPRSLLREHGFKKATTNAIHVTGQLTQEEFDVVVNQPRPPSPSRLAMSHMKSNPPWAELFQALSASRSHMRRHPAAEMAKSLGEKSVQTARQIAIELTEWLDEFERHLPK